jgi:tetratricopeptide (TPR) repeat protein
VELMRRLLLAVGAIALAVSPVLANDEQDCFQGQKPELRIKGCSEIIQRAPNDATAYHNHAVAYGLAGDVDRAIADYSKAVEIAPHNATAYENRGRAYASKGDFAHAVEDETKARELMAKAATQPTVVRPKAPKTPKTPNTTATATKATTVPPMTNVVPKAKGNVGKEAPASGWWSWLWGNDADQAGGKNAKP